MSKKRLALVTGGTRGIGKEISICLHHNGYEVIANYGANDDAAKEFERVTGITAIKWDVSDFESCKENIDMINQKFGPIEILVNNAGITRDKMLHKSSYQDWDQVLKTNLYSCFNTCHAVMEEMRKNNFGRIINISSINAQQGQTGQANYSAAKAGVIGFTKAIAREGAAKSITANVIAPGYIETEMISSIKEEIMDKIKAQIPVGRLGRVDEIARCVLFLASDDAEFITGSVLSVNGGQCMY